MDNLKASTTYLKFYLTLFQIMETCFFAIAQGNCIQFAKWKAFITRVINELKRKRVREHNTILKPVK